MPPSKHLEMEMSTRNTPFDTPHSAQIGGVYANNGNDHLNENRQLYLSLSTISLIKGWKFMWGVRSQKLMINRRWCYNC